jgi:YHS domain-containing protein
MARDPVCGMNVEENSQFKTTHAGATYVFCSASCKAKFDKEPERYIKQAGGGGHQSGHHHHCC